MIEATGLKPGDAISMFALLNPPPPTNMPGGYDFARTAWYQGGGGVGLVPGAPQIIQSPRPGWRLSSVMALNGLRWAIT
jgi:competence protein ComEC